MNIMEFKNFLEKFNIEDKKVKEIIENKNIKFVNGNVFLVKKEFEKNKIYDDGLIFIKLNKLLPSKFLLELIKKNSNNIVKTKSEKQAIKFTYSRNLSIKSIRNERNLKFENEKFYLVEFENKILGYFKINEDKKYQIKNVFNIGEYLKEN